MKHLVAHRGVSSLAPENTLSAIKLCKEHNVDWVEVDVGILGDGTIILSHDNTLDRCTDHTGPLSKITRDDLDTIDAGSWFSDQYAEERLPLLTDILDFVHSNAIGINIEIKDHDGDILTLYKLVDSTARVLQDYQGIKVMISSFNMMALRRMKKTLPWIDTAALFTELTDDWIELAKETRATFIHPKGQKMTPAIIKEITDNGYRVNAWTVDDQDFANLLWDAGVEGMITNTPQDFRNF